MTPVLTNETKEMIRKYEKLWRKIRDLIRSTTKNSEDYDEKNMKIKLDSNDDLPLNKIIEIYIVTMVVRAVFHENNKYYWQYFLDECLYKLWIIQKYYVVIELTFLKELVFKKNNQIKIMRYLSLLIFFK